MIIDSKRIIHLSPLKILLGATLIAEIFTYIVSLISTQLLWGKFPPRELIIIGVIDSFFVCIFVTAIVIYLMSKIKQEIQLNDDLLKEIENRKRLEADKLQLEIKLHQAYKLEAIGTLAGGIAHDFNNILGAILGYTTLAKDEAPPGTQLEKDLDSVLIAAQRAKDLIKQILIFSRQSNVELIPLKIQHLVKEALKMLRSSIPATIEIKEDIDSYCGTVMADPTQVHQILINLCTNAYHAMEEKGGVISVILKTTAIELKSTTDPHQIEAGNYAELVVSDTGPGISPDILSKIFDPYFTTKETGKGTGMGLSIVHGIITGYGGKITVDSQPGQGASFHVFFPLVQQETEPDIKEVGDIPKGNERILFVDDEEMLADMGKNMLERIGYEVTVRKSSLEALQKFQNQPDQFDLVITDLTMPGMTGYELARRILQIRPNIPIILCTGYSATISEEQAKAIGVKEFALKPLVRNDIARIIRKALDND